MRRGAGAIAAVALLGAVVAHAATNDLGAAELWKSLGDTHNACPESFDYFPSGGMRSFHCHLVSVLPFDLARLSELSGLAVFTSGPHRRALKLDAVDDFGHYNKAFVRWLTAAAIPAASDPALREQTQPLYDRVVAPLARIHLGAWRKLQANKGWLKRESEWLRASLASHHLEAGYYEKYYSFMDPGFIGARKTDLGDGAWEGNVVKTAVAFWLRRTVDGTADEFYAGLTRLMQTYDRDFFAFAGLTVELLDSPDDAMKQRSLERKITALGGLLVRNKAVARRARIEIFYGTEFERQARILGAALDVPGESLRPLSWKARGPLVVAFPNAAP